MDSSWVSATATRNICHGDPLLDWLDLYGKSHGYRKDDEFEGYDPVTDMGRFLREKGIAFEAAVMACICSDFQVIEIERGLDGGADARFQKTLEAIEAQPEIIYQPFLMDHQRNTYGIADLLVRSDVLNRLVNHPVMTEKDLDAPVHYRVIDIKFTSLELTVKGYLGNGASDLRKKAQLLVYNRALGEMQNYEPPTAYLLGRSWKQKPNRGTSCFDRLAPADMNDSDLHKLVDKGVAWIRRVREEGSTWQVLPEPSIPELYPNVSNLQDSPWHVEKKGIAEALEDITMLWQVTHRHREMALAAGVRRISDPSCRATVFQLSDKREATLQKILDINRGDDLVNPLRIETARNDWFELPSLEFYVDFETVTDLNDDFANVPERGGQSLIFMIGCGHVEDGEWKFQVFTCDRLTQDCERAIVEAWIGHMNSVRERLSPDVTPKVIHWSHAEQSFLDTAFNSARTRHNADWPAILWYDYLVRVMREEPVVVRGSLAFGLKHVAKAMHRNGMIATSWGEGPGDGLAAMVGAWRCDDEAKRRSVSMRDLPLMQAIETYNEVDCKVMQEIIAYLRAHH